MKKILFSVLTSIAALAVVVGCNNDPQPGPTPGPTPGSKTVSWANLLQATKTMYATWEEERSIPASVKVGDQNLSFSEFLLAEAQMLSTLADGKTAASIDIPSCTAPGNPDRDSYKATEIKVKDGAEDLQKNKEDISTIATRLVTDAKAKGAVPNQVNIFLAGGTVAFCSNRAFVTIARTIAEYAAAGVLPEKVSTDYLSAANSLKSWAKEFVGYLDVWEKTVADVLDADGTRYTGSKLGPWEFVHFVPIPQDTPYESWTSLIGKNQWDPKYQPYRTVTVGGVEYTAAQCWEIGIRGLMDMCTKEGNTFIDGMKTRNDIPTYQDNKSIVNAPINKPNENCIWGQYPWYEQMDQVTLAGIPVTEVDVEFLLRCGSVHVARAFFNNFAQALGKIGNFQEFAESEGTINHKDAEGNSYVGLIAPMREFLIMARIYKYLLDNNINSNIYTALKGKKFDYDLYKKGADPIVIDKDKLTFEGAAASQDVSLTTTGNWTATASESWVTVSPASGAAGESQTLTVSVAANTESPSRTATVTIMVDEYKKSIAITQSILSDATIGDFVNAYVGFLDVWAANKGDLKGGADSHVRNSDLTNINYIPFDATIDVKGIKYGVSDALEIAMRCYLLLTGKDGNNTSIYGKTSEFPDVEPATFATKLPAAHSYLINWWYLDDASNQGPIRYKGEANKMTPELFYNFIKRNVNFPPNNSGYWANISQYSSGELTSDYSGTMVPSRCQMGLLRLFKYLKDNNITSGVADAIAGKTFDATLYNNPDFD